MKEVGTVVVIKPNLVKEMTRLHWDDATLEQCKKMIGKAGKIQAIWTDNDTTIYVTVKGFDVPIKCVGEVK